MATMAVAFPILPGKSGDARRFAEEVMGPRRSEAAASWGRMGVTHESWYLQSTPMGDLIVVWMEAADPAAAFQTWGASREPYDVWFKQTAGAICGLDFNQPMPALPQQIMDWQA